MEHDAHVVEWFDLLLNRYYAGEHTTLAELKALERFGCL